MRIYCYIVNQIYITYITIQRIYQNSTHSITLLLYDLLIHLDDNQGLISFDFLIFVSVRLIEMKDDVLSLVLFLTN